MDPSRARVATFNIHHGRGRDGRVDLQRTAAVIAEMDPDLIALQELDVYMDRSGRVDQPSELAEMIGMEVHFFPTLTNDGAQYGIGLAARRDLHCNFEELPRQGMEERRIAITARWAGIDVVTAHLSREEGSRRLQMEALTAIARRFDGPTILLGDLNQPRRHLHALTGVDLVPVRPHVPLRWWTRPHPRVDHILVRGLHARRARLVPTRASDHSGLVAEVAGPDLVREPVGG